MERNRYADLLRVTAIIMVALGHWLLTVITYRGERLSGVDALDYIGWGRWVTLGWQVMPAFFLVGGYVDMQAWTRHHERGENWTAWVRRRVMALLWPVTAYVAAAVVVTAAASLCAVNPSELAEAGHLVSLQLWFIPVYVLLIALTPVMLAAHRRWGLAVPAVMAGAAALVDVAVLGPHLPLIGFANYLLVWGSMYQWGFSWRDGTLTRARWRPWALAVGGAAATALLIAFGPFPVDMIGAGERVGNTTPPSIALLTYAAAQVGLLIAAEPAATRLLVSARRWQALSRLNKTVMTVYLWHMAPIVLVAAAFYPTRIAPQPAIGTLHWWELRLAWWAVLGAILIPLVWAVMRLERPLLRLPPGLGRPGPWSPALLTVGIAMTMAALARFAIAGFAPSGHIPLLVLAVYAAGLIAAFLSGRAPAATRPEPGQRRAPGSPPGEGLAPGEGLVPDGEGRPAAAHGQGR